MASSQDKQDRDVALEKDILSKFEKDIDLKDDEETEENTEEK